MMHICFHVSTLLLISLQALPTLRLWNWPLDIGRWLWRRRIKGKLLSCHFEFNVMPFGLTNSPAMFQRLMECVLAGLVGEECLINLDDVQLIIQGAPVTVNRIFEALRNAGLQLKPSKCCFTYNEVQYLGHVVSKAGIRPDNDKIKAVSNYLVPKR